MSPLQVTTTTANGLLSGQDEPMFLEHPPTSESVDIAFANDLQSDGYVMNLTRLWSWRPDVADAFGDTRATLLDDCELTAADVALLVAATAAGRSDSYCSLAWGRRLAKHVGPDAAASVVAGGLDGLDDRARALTTWARQVVDDPNATTNQDVQALRDVGLSDRAIFEATAHIAFRLAFSTVNDALGAAPDAQAASAAPEAVRDAVRFGRPPHPVPS
jgi:alkylhydroperoxidase family enzyme